LAPGPRPSAELERDKNVYILSYVKLILKKIEIFLDILLGILVGWPEFELYIITQLRRKSMKKAMMVGLAIILVVVFAGSVLAADKGNLPGQKLTQDELASVTGKFSPVSVPTGFFSSLSTTGTTVYINGVKVAASSPVYSAGGVTVIASGTFLR
jgi:hypothetical protein